MVCISAVLPTKVILCKQMLAEARMSNDCMISTLNFPNGTYFCRATYEGKRLGMAKFIIQH